MKHSLLYIGALALLTACTDWTDHYDDKVSSGEMAGLSLYEQISAKPELSDFRAVLDSTHLYANNRRTTLHYSDVLAGNQFYTVWAPKNGTFNRDSLLQLCATTEGDSLVGRHFVSSHIARYRHSMGNNEQIVMLGGKTLRMHGNTISGATVEQANLQAQNGILHVLQTNYQYHYNIYECLTSLERYRHIGDFLRSYHIDEFDPNSSLIQGINEDGKTVYADSVFYTRNIILNSIDRIDHEDSTFMMFVPSAELWNRIYPKAKARFDYASIEKADSLQYLWSNYSLIQDLVYNPLWQPSIMDSIISTTGSRRSYPYHIYYRPFEPGGLMSYAVDSVICSNGVIYEMNEWPFADSKLYFNKLEREAEGLLYDSYETDKKSLTLGRYQTSADSVSNGYLNVSPVTATDSYYLEYEIPSVLRGDYDVYIIYLPKTVYDPTLDPDSKKTADRNAFRPCKFIADITYAGTDGKQYVVSTRKQYSIDPEAPSYYVEDPAGDYIMPCNFTPNTASTRAFTTNPYRVDTVKVASFHFPVCNYGMTRCSTRIKIINSVSTKENTVVGYSANMLIDKILLIPHDDETQE